MIDTMMMLMLMMLDDIPTDGPCAWAGSVMLVFLLAAVMRRPFVRGAARGVFLFRLFGRRGGR
jgi:hypothetical protein